MLTFRKTWHLTMTGLVIGAFAPIGWVLLRAIVFTEPGLDVWSGFAREITLLFNNRLLLVYMGGGTSAFFGLFGYLLGKMIQQLHERACRLSGLNRDISEQKDDYEQRLEYLTSNLKNFHVANANIQKSQSAEEIILLATDSLHTILNYDRVIMLMLDDDRTRLEFRSSRGSADDNVKGVSVPFNEEAGILYKVIDENRIYSINDFRTAPDSYRLKPPYDQIPQFRSIRFVISPIEVNGAVVGLFAVDNKIKKHDLDDADVETVRLIALQIGAALSRISLFAEVESLTREFRDNFSELIRSRSHYDSSLSGLEKNAESMAHKVKQISGSADSTKNKITDTSSTINEFSVAIRQVSSSIDHVNEFMGKAISSISEINVSAHEISENGNRSYEMASQVKDKAAEGEQLVAEGFRAWEQVSMAVTRTVEAFASLQRDVEEIEHVLKVIDEINQRTKLLSLNASIVSAQAGEHGKPFAVVAEEIGTLSTETADSASIIDELIQRVRTSSLAAGDNFQATSQLVDSSIELGKETGNALQTILRSAMDSMAMANEIRNATQEQIKGTQLVSDAIEDLGGMVAQTAVASRQQAAGLQRIEETVEDVMLMAEGVASLTVSHQDDVRDAQASVGTMGEMINDLFAKIVLRAEQNQKLVGNLEHFQVREVQDNNNVGKNI